MYAILTIQGDPARDTWSAVRSEAQSASLLGWRATGWQVARIRAQPEKHKVVLDLVREGEE